MATNADAAIQVRDLAKDLAAASGQPFKTVAADLILSAGTQIQHYAQTYAPRRTGRLAGSISLTTAKNGMSAVVQSGVPYDRFVEYGTGTRGEFPGRPIVIRPRRAQFLRFTTKDGRVVYTKKVVSPGMAPRPFLRPAVERISLPLATTLGNNAVIYITRGPQNPETLTNAPATGVQPIAATNPMVAIQHTAQLRTAIR